MYDWAVDLRNFKSAQDYPDYFNRMIYPEEVIQFENTFRESLNESDSFQIAGEVCFWKNYGNHLSRDKVTGSLLRHLSIMTNWNLFVEATKEISDTPSLSNFLALRKACKQPRGFATPIAFLAFYNPSEFPMVDKHIAYWWRTYRTAHGYANTPAFTQRDDGWIQAVNADDCATNWNAYLAWKRFCCDYSQKLQRHCALNWRARDIEIAVWMAQKNGRNVTVLE